MFDSGGLQKDEYDVSRRGPCYPSIKNRKCALESLDDVGFEGIGSRLVHACSRLSFQLYYFLQQVILTLTTSAMHTAPPPHLSHL